MFTATKRSQIMASIRGKGNKETEVALASIFRRNRVRGWRRHLPVRGNPDFAFVKERVAIFVDGCFWHGCRAHSRLPKSNQEYWEKKLARNRRRDRAVTRDLKKNGWHVVRLWQHELKKENDVLLRIRNALNGDPRIVRLPRLK
jgi:DNA mismatch endonuclease, patch repair protein